MFYVATTFVTCEGITLRNVLFIKKMRLENVHLGKCC